MFIGGTVLVVENISIMNNNSCEYLLEIHTKDRISSLNKKAFFLVWNKLLFCRKRRTEISQNVIRVYLKKGDTIQKYIDNISNVIRQVNNYLEFMQLLNIEKKNRILKRTFPKKSYVLADNSSIRSKVWRNV